MRLGVNPEKFKDEKNIKKQHRIIVVFYIPNISDDYYLESITVLEKCLHSISQTVNLVTTAVTLINNHSCAEANAIAQKYIDKEVIDKYVLYNENKGKVYAVLSEARASYENLITISDADILFLSGWENAVVSIFKSFPNAGVVSPLPIPNLVFSHNHSVFFDKYIFGKIHHQKIVNDYDLELYLKGLGNDSMLNRNNRKYSFKQKQYYLKNKKNIAILGAGHFVSTYKRSIFFHSKNFPDLKFSNGFEDQFIDQPSDKMGLYRLSTQKMFAYHIGNKMDDFAKEITFSEDKINPDLFLDVSHKLNFSAKLFYTLRVYIFKVIKKIKKL